MKRIIVFVLTLMAVLTAASDVVSAKGTFIEETVQGTPKQKKELKEVKFEVNLHCHSCVKKIQENIAFVKGVKELEVSLEEKTVFLKYDPSKTDEAKLEAAIRKLGYETRKINE